MSGRRCGECTACCDGWLSSKYVEMSPWKPCIHRTDAGCGIYADRPRDPCRTFRCAWLEAGSTLPEHLRPDLCGAIVLNNRQYRQWRVIIATPTGWKIPQATLADLMAYARQRGMPLIFIENLQKDGVYTHFSRSGYGPKEFVQSLQGPDDSPDLLAI